MKEQARWLSEIWGKVAESGGWFERYYNDQWRKTSSSPTFESDPAEWRTFKKVKPKPKIVDLSPLVNSGVLCQFFNGDKSYGGLSFLVEIDEDGCYVNQRTGSYTSCRPLLNHWNVIEGEEGKGTAIEGIDTTFELHGFASDKADVTVGRLIKYTGLQDGYEWP